MGAKAAVLAVILLTVRGVPTLYMGQEIGMSNTYIPAGTGGEIRTRRLSRFFKWIPEVANRRLAERLNRDEVRTPMQWDDTPHAGFCPAPARLAPRQSGLPVGQCGGRALAAGLAAEPLPVPAAPAT